MRSLRRWRYLEPVLFLVLLVGIGILIRPKPPVPPPPPPTPTAYERLQSAMEASLAAPHQVKREPYRLLRRDYHTLVFINGDATPASTNHVELKVPLRELSPTPLARASALWDAQPGDRYFITLRPRTTKFQRDVYGPSGLVYQGRTRVLQMPFFTRESADQALAALLDLIAEAGGGNPDAQLLSDPAGEI